MGNRSTLPTDFKDSSTMISHRMNIFNLSMGNYRMLQGHQLGCEDLFSHKKVVKTIAMGNRSVQHANL